MRSPHPVLRPAAVLALALFISAASLASTEDPPLPVKKAAGSIELTDPAGDIEPLHSSGDKDYPGYDGVKRSAASSARPSSTPASISATRARPASAAPATPR